MKLFSFYRRLSSKIERLIFDLKIIGLKQRRGNILIGIDVQLFGLPRIQLKQNTKLTIGNQCILRFKSNSNPIGVDHPVTFCTLSENARIVIGNRVGISGGSLCARQLIEIGDGTLIGANSYIFDNDFHSTNSLKRVGEDYTSVRSAPVRIGSNVFIGARSIVLKGVTIGDNSIIGAGSVVAQSIPADSIAAGNPCRVRTQQEAVHGE